MIAEGFKVGETTIRNNFRIYKDKKKEAFIRQSYNAGYRSEYDFHEVKVQIDGKSRLIYQATISLPYSNYKFVKHYENQKMESFIDSLVSFFEKIKGVPCTVVFDNMRNVVRKFLYNGKKEYTDEIIKLSIYYGFKIMTTNIYSGNEKGHVENSGKFARKELFTLNYKFDTIEEIRAYANSEMKILNEEINDKFKDEQKYLLDLPKRRYELGRAQKSVVNHEG